MPNLTSSSVFVLLEFSQVRELQLLHFFMFLLIYLITLLGNVFTIVSITLNRHLHTPMYFFLMNLAIIDIGSISAIVPKSMMNSLMNSRFISYSECATQVFFFFFFDTCEIFILTLMAHDRHVAICNPLQYEAIMNKEACLEMVATAWIFGLLYAIANTGSTFSLTFCSNNVDQFFCEIPKLLKLSCSDFYLVEIGFLVVGCVIALGCFIFIIATYVWIFTAVLQIPSVQGRQKALSTCLPHLIVVSLFVFIALFIYAKPPSNSLSELELVIAVVYAVVPPLLNPFIYSIRNKELKNALWKFFSRRQTFITTTTTTTTILVVKLFGI